MPSKRAMFLFTFFAVVFSVFLASPAGAQSVDDIGRGLMIGASKIVLSMAELCIRLSVFCLQFFISLAQWNNYIDLPIVMLGWTMVRDVANMFFVVVFLVIAIGTILGLEQYQWNKTLAKMVLAAVFINFSNLICGIFIDIAHVFTITFVNAISATAGGNLINMFKLESIFKLTTDTSALGPNKSAEGNIDMRLLSASVAAFLFAGLSLITIAVYTIVMLYRVIILWVLVILSPIAYISSVLPQSQSYAKEWWDEFSRYVLVAPMMVFFLWLAFATMGAGNIASDEKSGMGLKVALPTTVNEGSYSAEELGSGDAAASLSEVTKWANLANILIPICLLWVGMERVQKLGVRGGDMVGKGMDFFKKAATVATGVAAGRWLARKGWEGTKAVGGGLVKAGKVVGWYGIGGKQIKEYFGWHWEGLKAWRNKSDFGPKMEWNEEKEKWEAARYKEGPNKGAIIYEEGNASIRFKPLQKWLHSRAVADAFSAKRLRRMTDFNKTREELLESRTSANPSHSFFMTKAEREGAYGAGIGVDVARIERGELKQEKKRSESKTARGEAEGAKGVGASRRYKATKKGDFLGIGGTIKIGFEEEGRPSVTGQIGEHEIAKEALESALATGLARARADVAESEMGEEYMAMISDQKKETEIGKAREELVRQGIEVADSDEARAEFRQKQEQEEKIEDGLKSVNQRILEGEIGALTSSIEEKQQEILKPILDKEKEEEDTYLGNKKKKEGELQTVKDEELALRNKDGAVKDWIKKHDGLKDSLEDKDTAIKEVEASLQKEKDQKKRQKLDVRKQKLDEEKKQIEEELKATDASKPAELVTAEEKTNNKLEELKVLNGEWKERKREFDTEKKVQVNKNEELVEMKNKKEEKEKLLRKEEEVYQKTEEYKRNKTEADLAKLYIEGGEAALRDSLSGTVSAEKLDAEVAQRVSKYQGSGYTGGFQSVEGRKIATDFRLEQEKEAVKAAEAMAKEGALGVSGIRAMFEASQVSKLLEESAQKFLSKIEQADLSKIFKSGLRDMEEEEKKAKKLREKQKELTKASVDKQADLKREIAGLTAEIQHLHQNAGARMARGEVASNYAKEASTILRQELVDTADTEYSRERYGFDTPSSAYKSLIKKKMEDYTGVEREQAIRMSFDSLGKILRLQSRGEEVERDQTAMSMAGITYLTKQAWSDDLLNLIVDQIEKGNRGELSGEDREIAEEMKRIFIDTMHWGEVDKKTGGVEIVSESSNRWTNDLHRLIGRGGNVDKLMSENAALDVMTKTGKGLSGSAETIIGGLMGEAKRQGIDTNQSGWEKKLQNFDKFAESLGFVGDRAQKELESMARMFVTGSESVNDGITKFRESLKKDFEAMQMLADAKNLALNVAHLDDGGHTIYDVNEGVFRGQTAEDAMNFILSDWRKIGADERIKRLKIHSVAQMNEHTGTVRMDERNLGAISETFANTDTELIFNKSDGRNVDQIAGLAAGEKAILDEATGAMKLGDLDSKMVKETFGHIKDAKQRQAAALAQLANNYAAMMTSGGSTVFLAGSLGKRSNLNYSEATQGSFNLILPNGKHIRTLEEFVDFVEENRTNKETVKYSKRQVEQIFNSRKRQYGRNNKPPVMVEENQVED